MHSKLIYKDEKVHIFIKYRVSTSICQFRATGGNLIGPQEPRDLWSRNRWH